MFTVCTCREISFFTDRNTTGLDIPYVSNEIIVAFVFLPIHTTLKSVTLKLPEFSQSCANQIVSGASVW